nr:MAG TPA: PcfK-like protein [Caudoviricetes sp.]
MENVVVTVVAQEEIRNKAKQKLEQELKESNNKGFAEPIINYLQKRIQESDALSSDICQEHKTCGRCLNYIYEKAREELSGKNGAIRDDVVYEWAEDYYHKDDKEEVEKELKGSKEKAGKIEPVQKEEPKPNDSGYEKPNKEMKKDRKPAGTGKKKTENVDGQLDMFSLLGI